MKTREQNKNQRKHMKFYILTASLVALLACTAQAQSTAFTYQGQLNANGSPAPADGYDMIFQLRNASGTVGTFTCDGITGNPPNNQASLPVKVNNNGLFT